MRHKKKPLSSKTPEQEALEKHVDAMMDPKQPDEPAAIAALAAVEPASPGSKSVDAGSSAPTAPELSAKLRKQAGITDTPAKPIHIKQLDEVAEAASSSEEASKDEKPAQQSDQPEELAETEQESPEQEEQNDIDDQSADLDDKQTDKAVDDIVAHEGDVMLAVADATAEARSEELGADEPKGHPVLSTIFWGIIALLVILIILFIVLLIMGDNLANKLGL
jgi:hypothetical protein